MRTDACRVKKGRGLRLGQRASPVVLPATPSMLYSCNLVDSRRTLRGWLTGRSTACPAASPPQHRPLLRLLLGAASRPLRGRGVRGAAQRAARPVDPGGPGGGQARAVREALHRQREGGKVGQRRPMPALRILVLPTSCHLPKRALVPPHGLPQGSSHPDTHATPQRHSPPPAACRTHAERSRRWPRPSGCCAARRSTTASTPSWSTCAACWRRGAQRRWRRRSAPQADPWVHCAPSTCRCSSPRTYSAEQTSGGKRRWQVGSTVVASGHSNWDIWLAKCRRHSAPSTRMYRIRA